MIIIWELSSDLNCLNLILLNLTWLDLTWRFCLWNVSIPRTLMNFRWYRRIEDLYWLICWHTCYEEEKKYFQDWTLVRIWYSAIFQNIYSVQLHFFSICRRASESCRNVGTMWFDRELPLRKMERIIKSSSQIGHSGRKWNE
jgi:hypothetical protein